MPQRYLWTESALSELGVQALRDSSWANCDGYLVWIRPVAALRSILSPALDPVGVELGVAIDTEVLPPETIEIVAQEVHRRISFEAQNWAWHDRTLKCLAPVQNPENALEVLRALIAVSHERGLMLKHAPGQ